MVAILTWKKLKKKFVYLGLVQPLLGVPKYQISTRGQRI